MFEVDAQKTKKFFWILNIRCKAFCEKE